MSKKEIWKLFIGSILFSLLSCSLVIYFHIGISHEVTWDLLGVFSGVLSILVTALIGWQIHNVIFWKKEIDNRINKIITEEIKHARHEMNLLVYESYLTNLQGYIKAKDWFKIIVIQNTMIDILETLKNADLINSYAKHISFLLEHTKEMNDDEIQEIKELIENLRKLCKYSDAIVDIYALAKNKFKS